MCGIQVISMSIGTDASELSEDAYSRRAHLNREYEAKYGKGNIFNGSTKFVNAMLTMIVLLLVAAITAQIQFNMRITDEVASIKTTMGLLLDGRIKEGK